MYGRIAIKFRDAYKKVGNLCNDRVRKKMEAVIGGFHFETVRETEERLSIPRP